MPEVLLALFMAASVSTVALSCLVGILIFWIADRRGQRRTGRHLVRCERTRPSSRGQRPYRSGRVRL